MNPWIRLPWIRLLLLPSSSGFLGGWMRWGQLLVLRIENYLQKLMNPKLTKGMKMWNEKGNSTTLLFYLKGLGILHQERKSEFYNDITIQHVRTFWHAEQQSINKELGTISGILSWGKKKGDQVGNGRFTMGSSRTTKWKWNQSPGEIALYNVL